MKEIALGILVAATAALSGCVTATPVSTPSGQHGYAVNCTSVENMGACYQKAGTLCGSLGYTVVSQVTTAGNLWVKGQNSMVIQCKLPASST